MSATARVCPSAALTDGGPGVRFTVVTADGEQPAFAVRFGGRVYAYRNRCAHRGVELDWEPGQFFDAAGRYLICATHGARYDPATGVCVEGPCRGAGLAPVPVVDRDGFVSVAAGSAAVVK